MASSPIKPTNSTACIALGGNLGNPKEAFDQALNSLDAHPRVSVQAAATPIRTSPAETTTPQPDYLNSAAVLLTDLKPHELLDLLLLTERQLGRDRSAGEINQPRMIDLDLLLFDDVVIKSDELTLPHPRMHTREFVLVPLAEVAPDIIHPVTNSSITTLLHAVRKHEDPTQHQHTGISA